jgi:preprotein translocase subunit SecE
MAESIKEKRQARRKRNTEPEATVEAVEESKGVTEKKGRPTPSRRKGETQKHTQDERNAITRGWHTVTDYFHGVRSEIQKVTWPTREETNRLTRIVGIVLIASSLVLGGLSILFTELFNIGVNSPLIFVGVFVVFVGLLFAYSRYVARSESVEF